MILKKPLTALILSTFFLLQCTKTSSPVSSTVKPLPDDFKDYVISLKDVDSYCLNNPKCKKDQTGDISIEGFEQYQIKDIYWIKKTVSYDPKTFEVTENNFLLGHLDWTKEGSVLIPLKRGGDK